MRYKIVKKTKKGFTLLELLAVVVIIAVLASAGVPIYMKYQISAYEAEAENACNVIYKTLLANIVKHNGKATKNTVFKESKKKYVFKRIKETQIEDQLYNAIKLPKDLRRRWKISLWGRYKIEGGGVKWLSGKIWFKSNKRVLNGHDIRLYYDLKAHEFKYKKET